MQIKWCYVAIYFMKETNTIALASYTLATNDKITLKFNIASSGLTPYKQYLMFDMKLNNTKQHS